MNRIKIKRFDKFLKVKLILLSKPFITSNKCLTKFFLIIDNSIWREIDSNSRSNFIEGVINEIVAKHK
jgi:hypothetical protein